MSSEKPSSSDIPKDELPPKMPPVTEKPLDSAPEVPLIHDATIVPEVPSENPFDTYMDDLSFKLSSKINKAVDGLEVVAQGSIDAATGAAGIAYEGIKMGAKGIKKGIEGTPEAVDKLYKGASSILESAYKGLYKIPGVNRLVGKMEIGYNQFWADKHEEKAVALKGEMDGFDIRIATLNDTERGLENSIKELEMDGTPGAEKIRLKINEIKRQKGVYLNEKAKVSTKLKARQEKVGSFMHKRDEVAQNLKEFYDKKLEPMNAELDKLASSRSELELDATITELQHRKLTERLDVTKSRKAEFERLMKATGMDDKEISKEPIVKQWNQELLQGYEKMKNEKAVLDKKIYDLDRKMAKTEMKANPYRDEREEFVRVTQRGRVDINVPPKVDGKPFEGRTDVDATGAPLPREEYRETTRARNIILDESLPAGGFAGESGPGRGAESRESQEDKRPTLEAFVTQWNMLPGNIKNIDLLPKIDTVDFFKTLKGLNKEFKLSMPEFKKVLTGYYKVKGKLTGPAKTALNSAFTAWEAKIRRDNERNK